ncbi:hypothetical protein tb265_40590 [Gemmatimonadetes bacterium T265]|nr:hypothetical protein tb265_40590 [Gemmatimonadetes bacterium T265]
MDAATEAVDPRPLSAPERDLIGRMLDYAFDPGASAALREQLAALRVVARCTCGCPSLFFDPPPDQAGARREMVADLYGATPEGHAVGLLLWAVAGGLEYLEVYTLGVWPPYSLPVAVTVTPEYPSGPHAA